MGHRCFFIGHRETGKEMAPALRAELRRHIEEYGVMEFVVGHYGGFDFLVREAVAGMKAEYPQITLTLLLPYHPQEHPMALPPGVDGTVYPGTGKRAPACGHRAGKSQHGGCVGFSYRLRLAPCQRCSQYPGICA